MRGRFERWFGGLTVIAAAAAAYLLVSVLPVTGQAQAPAYKAPRTKDGKADLNGIWSVGREIA